MSLTFSAEIGSENNSPSLRYFPFENFVTNISIFRYTSEILLPGFGSGEVALGEVALIRFRKIAYQKSMRHEKLLRT